LFNNWADLKCNCAEQYIMHNGEKGHRVYIDEADPDCPVFHMHIIGELTKLGFVDIDVVTEW